MSDENVLVPSWPRVMAAALLVLFSAYAVGRVQLAVANRKPQAVKVVAAGRPASAPPAAMHASLAAPRLANGPANNYPAVFTSVSRPVAPLWPWLMNPPPDPQTSVARTLPLPLGEEREPADAPPPILGLDGRRAAVTSQGGAPVYFGGLSEAEFREKETRCLATAIYYEARSEPVDGQLAVAQVIMNRVRSEHYPATVCGVVYEGAERGTGCQFSFTCGGAVSARKDPRRWAQALELARRVADGQVWLKTVGHATHYHATYVSPVWTRDMNRIQQIGRHIFYRPKSFRAPLQKTVVN